jgi:hypothetical protein
MEKPDALAFTSKLDFQVLGFGVFDPDDLAQPAVSS